MLQKEKLFFGADKKANALFVLILLVNVLIKSIGITQNSFNYDESISLKNVALEFGHVKHEAEWDNNPPFFYYCVWVWHHIFSINEFNSRILTVIFSALAIALISRFIYRKTNLLIAGFLAIVLSFHSLLLYYAQEVRSYSLVLLLSVISTITFFSFLEKRSWLKVCVLGLINFLLVYTHYVTGLILLVQLIVVLVYYRDLVFKFLSTYLICALLIFIRFTKKQFLNIAGFNSTGDFWLKKPDFKNLTDVFIALSNNQWILILFLISCFFSIALLFRKEEESTKPLLLYALFMSFFSVLFLYVISQVKALFLARYLIFSVPFIFILLGFDLHRLANKFSLVAFSAIALIAVLSYRFTIDKKDNYRAVAQLVKSIKKPEDIVLIHTKDDLHLFHYYFDQATFLNKNFIDVLAAEHVFGINSPEEFSPDKINGSRIYLIEQFVNGNENDAVRSELQKNYTVFHHLKSNSIDLFCFIKK